VVWWSYSFCVVVGGGRGCAPCRSWTLTGGSCGRSWAVVPVLCCGGWSLFVCSLGFVTACDNK
jgi:hypothetical protein